MTALSRKFQKALTSASYCYITSLQIVNSFSLQGHLVPISFTHAKCPISYFIFAMLTFASFRWTMIAVVENACIPNLFPRSLDIPASRTKFVTVNNTGTALNLISDFL